MKYFIEIWRKQTIITDPMIKTFSDSEIVTFLSLNLKEWTFENNTLKRDFRFTNFVDAFSFMTAIALNAEKMDHHPDWRNVYNTVNIKLNTYDAGGITKLDFELAHIIDNTYNKYQRTI